jgi:hypothetical protein
MTPLQLEMLAKQGLEGVDVSVATPIFAVLESLLALVLTRPVQSASPALSRSVPAKSLVLLSCHLGDLSFAGRRSVSARAPLTPRDAARATTSVPRAAHAPATPTAPDPSHRRGRCGLNFTLPRRDERLKWQRTFQRAFSSGDDPWGATSRRGQCGSLTGIFLASHFAGTRSEQPSAIPPLLAWLWATATGPAPPLRVVFAGAQPHRLVWRRAADLVTGTRTPEQRGCGRPRVHPSADRHA